MKTPEEIKKGLQCCAKDGCYDCPYVTECDLGKRGTPYDADALSYIQQLEDHIRDITKMIPTWISVEDEQKPKQMEQVLCTYGFDGDTEKHVDKLTYFAYGDNGYVTGAHFTDEGMCGMRVTHWMPRPEPAK